MNKKYLYPGIYILVSTIIMVFALWLGPPDKEPGDYAGDTPSVCPATDPAGAREAAAYKSETVYVMLDHCGEVIDQRIVNRIYRSEDISAPSIADYGSYTSVTNLVSGDEPKMLPNRVLWDSSLLQENGDIYYEGITGAELPVDFNITYYLDGEKTDAVSLAGRSGHLEIVLALRNRLGIKEPVSYKDADGNRVQKDDVNYVPLLVQGTYTADLGIFSDIKCDNGANIIIGQSANVNFMAFPYPEDEIVISMQGKDIELNNIMLMIIPQLPPLPDMDIEDDFVAMLDGVRQISDGMTQLYDGADEMYRGMRMFSDEVGGMTGDFEALPKLSDMFAGMRELAEEMDDLDDIILMLEELLENLERMPDPGNIFDGIDITLPGADSLAENSRRLNREVDALTGMSAQIEGEARKLMAKNDKGTELYELGALLLAREEQVKRVAAESDSVDEGVKKLSDAGIQQELMQDNRDSGDSGDSITDRLRTLLEYLYLLQDTLDEMEEAPQRELEEFLEEAEEVFKNLEEIPGMLDEIVNGQRQIRDGIGEVHEKGILEMKSGLAGGVNEIRFGNAKIDRMGELADEYRSYADNENNRKSSVQFVLQTETVNNNETPDEDKRDDKGDERGGGLLKLWRLFIGLFDFSGRGGDRS